MVGLAGAEVVGHCHCGEEEPGSALTAGCQRTEGPESMMEELERSFLSSNILLSLNFRAVLQLTSFSLLLTRSLKDNIFSLRRNSLCLGLWQNVLNLYRYIDRKIFLCSALFSFYLLSMNLVTQLWEFNHKALADA